MKRRSSKTSKRAHSKRPAKRDLPFTELVLALYKNPKLVDQYNENPWSFLAALRFLTNAQRYALFEGDVAGVTELIEEECAKAFRGLRYPNNNLSGIQRPVPPQGGWGGGSRGPKKRK